MDPIGRSRELEDLEELFSRGGATTCAVYGRRGIGKTSLLTRFCENRRSLHITALGLTREATMEGMRSELERFFGENLTLPKNPRELSELLSTIDGERTVVVLDEYPNMTKVFPEASAVLQRYIDREMRCQNVTVQEVSP